MADDKVEIINPPNTLKSKVKTGGPGAVDLETLNRAEQVILELTDDYLKWVQDDLRKLDTAYGKLAAAGTDCKAELEGVFQVAHDIKGQGGSFGYDLMTAIGNQLCRLIEKLDSVGPDELDAIKVHMDSMKLVIQSGMKGDGGREGTAVLAGIQKVYDKLTA